MDVDALKRLDAFPYTHRVADVMVHPVATARPDDTLEDTIARLNARNVGSCVVVDDRGRAIGILTERDVLGAIGRSGPAALGQRLGALMSAPVEWVAPDALLYRAMARMDRRRIRHLAVLDDAERPIGMVTARALLRLRAGPALAIGDAVELADNAAALRAVHDGLPALARGLRAEGIGAAEICGVISAITRDITARTARLAEAAMAAEGRGPAPGPWCLLVLGSAGRGESLLAPDQDNAAIVGEAGAAEIDGWFLHWAERLNGLLDDAGIPLCKGGVMVRNRAWRHSVPDWDRQTGTWVGAPHGEALLNVDIFFDATPVAGDRALATAVSGPARRRAASSPAFLRLLAEHALSWRPPLGLFGRLRLENGRLDLKKGGLLPIVTAARVIGLAVASTSTGTGGRLQAAADAGRIGADNAADLERARQTFVEALLGQQLADLAAGRPAGNLLDPAPLDRAGRRRLVGALRQTAEAGVLVRDVLTAAPAAR